MSRISHPSERAGRAKSAAPAFSRSTSRPESRASDSVLFPKPQGALKKRTRPRSIKLSNRCRTDGFTIIFPVTFSLLFAGKGTYPVPYAFQHHFIFIIHNRQKM